MIKNPNEYTVFKEETYIRLTDKDGNHKAFAIIDTEDLERVKPFRWYHLNQGKSGGYAITSIKTSEKAYTVSLHELVMKLARLTNKSEYDHRNRNSLDCRKSNLRVCSKSVNRHNTGLPVSNTSGHKGVYWDKRRRKWVAEIKINNRKIFVGRFSIIEEAAKAREEVERRYL